MKKTFHTYMLFFTATVLINRTAVAQQQISTPKYVTSEDSVAMNALVLYPSEVRTDIFEACEYPSAIVDIATLQKKTSNDFAGLISSYSKDKQEFFWNVSRYPKLVTDLVEGGRKSDEHINAIVSLYPSDIHEAAMKYGGSEYDELQLIENLNNQTNSQFAQIISDYPPVTQNALRALLQYPEILSLLNDHLDLTVRVGGHYRKDPQEVINRANERNAEEVKQNTEDAEAWKQNMQQNPDEANDLKNASADYATENGYTTDEINTAPDPDYINNYTCSPYSYWFGYPTWYPYSYWYPYPFWFDCGFYYDSYGNMTFFGHPSYYFTNWYFYNPEHIHHYPHLCNTYIDHYYGPHRHVGGSDVIVRNWVRENKPYLPKDFTSNKSNRVEAIKQVGQLNMDARKEQGGKTISPAQREQYFQKNNTKYPSLNANHEPIKENEGGQQNINVPEKQPPARIPKQSPQTTVNPAYENKQEPRPSNDNFNKIHNAQEYHKDVWENRPAPVERPQMPSQPAQRSQPQQQRQSPPANHSSSPRGR